MSHDDTVFSSSEVDNMKLRSTHALLALLLPLAAACGADSGYAGGSYDNDEDQNSSTGNEKRDAGKGKDGGAWDAGVEDEEDRDTPRDEDEDSEQEESASDAGPSWSDAGKQDAGSRDSQCATLTYETFGKQFMTSYCVSCHAGSAPKANLKLDTLTAVAARKAGVKTQVLNGTMPQGNKKPSQEERTKLGAWIDCGAR